MMFGLQHDGPIGSDQSCRDQARAINVNGPITLAIKHGPVATIFRDHQQIVGFNPIAATQRGANSIVQLPDAPGLVLEATNADNVFRSMLGDQIEIGLRRGLDGLGAWREREALDHFIALADIYKPIAFARMPEQIEIMRSLKIVIVEERLFNGSIKLILQCRRHIHTSRSF
jgi:hypothetical protein